MSTSPNLLAVLQQLKSEKIKERQSGLASLRSTFEHDSAIRHLDKSGDGRAWLVLFQALFTAVANERAAFTKKGKGVASTSQAAQRRLNDVAAAVRWLTERSVERMNKSVTRGLLAHLLQTMVHQGQLFAPVALDYIKALKCLVSWTPHSERLDADTWVRMVEIAFNVILGDSLRQSLDDGDGEDEHEASTGPGTEMDDSESLYLDDDLDEGEDDNGDLPSTSNVANSKKRKRRDPSATPRTRLPTSKLQPKSQQLHAVTLEQIELTSLLAALLRSPSAPFLSLDYPYLPSAILRRLQRILDRYPADTSLHHDYLLALSATLSTLSLNRKYDVEIFARGAWDGLVGLWGTKNKGMKEGLVAVLRVLFPFVTADQGEIAAGYNWGDGIGRLWHLLDGEAESRWGVDGMSFESLRLEVLSTRSEDASELAAFVANTFRAGWHFDAGQALAWAILELQADCAEKLFQLSESNHSSLPKSSRSGGKRTRLENPITSLLQSIRIQSSSTVRAYHLQILLFFIDRHWLVLHDTFQQEVMGVLLQFVSSDIGVIQSWTFLCYAAIVYADTSVQATPPALCPTHDQRTRDATTWDPIWTHAIRRANVPAVCRAACHAAYTLLCHAKQLLTSQRVLLEIETLAKDLDVQGPAFPHDSVCVFLAQCLRIASQDVRLFRMQLEEKVLSWLLDCWRVEEGQMVTGGGGGGSKMPTHTIRDMLVLLESICGLPKRSDLVFRVLLPECPIVETMVDQGKTKVIRDFLLNGRLPPYRKPSEKCNELGARNARPLTTSGCNIVSNDLIQPRGRERKVSSFMLKSLEALISEWNAIKEASTHPTAERARRSLDMVVTALAFESLLILNGMRLNRRVVQCACKLVSLVTPLLTDSRWTAEEKALILLGLEPLTSTGDEERGEGRWEAMLPPDTGTGIKTQTLRALVSDEENRIRHVQASRREFQRVIWQSADVQDVFGIVMNTLKDVLRCVVGHHSEDPRTPQATDTEDKDGFGPIRTTQQSPEFRQQSEDDNANRCIVEVCMTFLTVAPILQSSSGEPTRDKELVELTLNCDNKFFLLASILFDKVRQKTLNLNVNNLDMFLDRFAELLPQYQYAKSERLQLLVTHFLDSTLHLWFQNSVTNSEVGDHIRSLCTWISGVLRSNKIQSWKTRDRVACFLDRYLAQDPFQVVWSQGQDDEGIETLPAAMLPSLGADEDIRVRFRAAVANSRLFTIARLVGQDPLLLYDTIKSSLTLNIYDYEHVITRLLSLGNIMIVSSAVRRGPYWHLLETCLHSQLYTRHVGAILSGVSERMGLTSFSVLFEAYASQIAYSIRQAGLDFLQFPPHLLGYRDRKECAAAAFRAFTPTNVLAGGPKPEAIIHGRKLFKNHCKVIQKSFSEGIAECFGDIVGFQIVSWIDEHTGHPALEKDLDELLRTKTTPGDKVGTFEDLLQQNVDGVVAAILRTLSDQDFSPEGPIVTALGSVDESGKAAQAFQAMTCYRKADDFASHSPNLPTFDAVAILKALSWLRSRLSDLDTKATSYHILHELFADVQRSPLVNEQIRLVNAISLWVAYHHDDFEELTLLHTLMRGATSLMAQSDLARVAQSIVEWALTFYRRITQKDPRLPDILIRICCLAQDFALDTRDSAIANMGNDLLRWIDGQASALCKITTHRAQVVRALPAWPLKPSPDLTVLYEDISSETLSAILADFRISSNKFRLVRRLRDLAVLEAYDEDRFAKTDFWRLKECIPPANQLQDEDIDAFADLLVLNKGRIDSFRSDQNPTALARHRQGSNRRKDPTAVGNDTSPQYSIIVTLLAMLDGNAVPQVHVAYRTLRLLMSVSTSDSPQFQFWPSEHRIELEYLQSYRRTPGTRLLRGMNELLNSEVCHEVTREFPKWVAMITTLLSDILAASNPFYAQLTSILRSDITFAEQMLPVLVHTVLHEETPKEKGGSSSCRSLLSSYFSSVLASETASTSCLRSIVEIVLHLRNFRPLHFSDALAHDRWLDIDFTLLARSATTCGAYTTALLFLELASEYQNAEGSENAIAEQILFDIYTHIDEPDGFYGIKTKDLRQFLIKRFHHEKQWEKAFRFHGAALEAGSTDPHEAQGLLQSFHSFGFDHLAIESLQSSAIGAGSMFNASSMSYHSGWRTETWDLPDQAETQNADGSLYLALRAIYRERDPQTVDAVVRHALSQEMGRLRGLGIENHAEIREVSKNLMCLSQITHWRNTSIQNRLSSKCIDTSNLSDFIHLDSDFDFSDLENIMATRISLIRSVRQKEEREQIGTFVTPFARSLIDVEKSCLVRLSEAARDARQIQIALNSIIRAQRLEKIPTFEVSQEFASVLWLQKEQKLAVQFLKDLVLHPHSDISSHDSIDDKTKALLLARLGAWTSEACLEKPTDILAHFFDPATSLAGIEVTRPNPTCAAIYHQCAVFAERQYHAILKSPDAIRWKVYVDRKTEEISRRQDQISRARNTNEYNDLNKEQDKAKTLLKGDQELFQRHNGARDAFLEQAIDMYSLCLQTSDDFDDDGPIRLCSLWFSNFDNLPLQDKIRVALDRVPSRKFTFLAHQLSARLSKPQTVVQPKNQENLQSLVVRLCQEHPFHSLYQVYCLRPGGSSSNSTSTTRRQPSRHDPVTSQTERSAAAGDIFDRLRGHASSGERVRAVEHICDASFQWAKYPIKDHRLYKGRKGPFKVPDDLLIRKIANIQVPVVTVHTPLDHTLRYDNCTWIDHYDSSFDTAGGINLPKINVCYGSDGEKYKQLFKGEGGDDLRQDAVMEQVFYLVNIVLRRDRETRRRSLGVRDYKVIPLAAQAGVLEFVGNTSPLMSWLVHANQRYRPNEMTPNEAHTLLSDKRKECGDGVDPLHALFLDLRKQVKPVLRHYFTERHKTPISWFAMRLKYSRSVATTSIVGHILGLGDRHSSNILIDNVTGEVVHIDLGIAFDQGKLLKVPERVPFRMTGNIVDAMGTSGTQGVFQRCAEETLRVLREGSEVIMTVLEVFKHDPLHSWTASELKVKRVQGTPPDSTAHGTVRLGIGIDMSSGTADEAADRALSSVARKLDKALSVEYTVNELIAEATDPVNLATIFSGWGPLY